MPAFVETMAYAGEVPWHGLGTQLPADASAEEMLVAAGLDWRICRTPAAYYNPVVGQAFEVEDRFFLYRDRDGALISPNPVSSIYTEIQNDELFQFGDALSRLGEARWHTAGSLFDGGCVWALAHIGEQFEYANSGAHARFLLLYDDRRGRRKFRARYCLERVVCHNTAQMAFAEDQLEFSMRHVGSLEERLEEAACVLEIGDASFRAQEEVVRELWETPFSATDMKLFSYQMLSGEDEIEDAMVHVENLHRDPERKKALTRFMTQADELLRLYQYGKGNVGETKGDAFSSVTEYVDHQRGRMKNWTRQVSKLTPEGLASAWFGDGNKKKKRALKLLVGGGVE